MPRKGLFFFGCTYSKIRQPHKIEASQGVQMLRTIVAMVGMFMMAFAMQARGNPINPAELNLRTGDSAMQIALQQEVYGILLSDTKEVHAEYRANGTFYDAPELQPYRDVFQIICADAGVGSCPEIVFTRRTEQGIAAMYPNGVLALNADLMRRLSVNEVAFVLAHEYAHFYFQHSKRRMKVLAKAVVDNSVMLREPEQALSIAGFLPEVRAIHQAYERESDAYGFDYLKRKGLTIECVALHRKIAGDAPISTDTHDSTEARCAAR